MQFNPKLFAHVFIKGVHGGCGNASDIIICGKKEVAVPSVLVIIYIGTDRVVFVLMLDKEKKKERILIGTEFSIESTLRYGKSIEDFMIRAQGVLLFKFIK